MSTILSGWIKAQRVGGLCIICAVALGACGGGGSSSQSAGIGGTGMTARGFVQGEVTGFGSVFVNGNKFNIDTSNFTVDGKNFVGQMGQAELSLGMVVQLEVETEAGVFTDKALNVIYDDEVQGPVAALAPFVPGETQRTFNVFGQMVTIDATGTVFKGVTFAGLTEDDLVEVSGFRVSPSTFRATYIEKKGVFEAGKSEVELRGEVDLYFGGTTFKIGATVINIDPLNTVIDVPGGVLANGMLVEVKGVMQGDLSVTADEIEIEDDAFDGDFDEVSLQGIISNYLSNSDFKINGLPINAGGAQISPAGAALGNGVEIEVEGDLVGGVLIADEVELRGGDSELRSFVGAVDLAGGTFTVSYPVPGTVTVHVDNSTLFEDDSGGTATPPFSLDDLNSGNIDFVRVEGIEIANDEILATSVRRRASPDSSHKLEGMVDNFVLGSFIRVLGINYGLDSATTTYEPSPPTIVQGNFVEIEDDRTGGVNPPGTADKVELED